MWASLGIALRSTSTATEEIVNNSCFFSMNLPKKQNTGQPAEGLIWKKAQFKVCWPYNILGFKALFQLFKVCPVIHWQPVLTVRQFR